MARWTITPASINNTMQSKIDINPGEELTWQVYQNEKPFLEQAKQDREATKKNTDKGYKKFATIPDLVAWEVLQKYGIDIHAPEFLYDTDKKARFMTIIKTEYPHLLSY